MDKVKNYIIISLIFLILTGLCVFFWYKYIELRNKPPQTIISTITEIKIDTLKYSDTLMYPVPVEVIKPVYDTCVYRDWETDRKSTRLNSSHSAKSRMPSSA